MDSPIPGLLLERSAAARLDFHRSFPATPVDIATYQSLTHFEKNGEIGTLVKRLETAGVRTLVFDEAHHLRNQWWKSLHQIKAGLKSPFIIALTATPPYDVPQIEWNRYASICGLVDEEISAPELVKAKNLCPHQDFIYFCGPRRRNDCSWKNSVAAFAVFNETALNEAFIQAVQQHPVLKDPADHIDELLDDSDYYLSLAVFLKHAHGVAPEALLKVLGLDQAMLPTFSHGLGRSVVLRGVVFRSRVVRQARRCREAIAT